MGLAVGIAALFALIGGLWMWEQTPDYRVLYGNLSDHDGGTIIESLQQMNIPYKVAGDGRALMVPSKLVYEARLKLAAQGLPKGENVGFELMDNQRFGITQFTEQVNYQRMLESELARSVQTIGAVAAARVHLAIPKSSVSIKDQQKPSASVVLALQSGRLLDSAQVSAITHLISSSVPELSTQNVTVVDQDGTLLSAGHDGDSYEGLDANQLKYVQQIERSYIERINTLLVPILGANNLRAQVSADIDFSRTEQTSETFKPNQSPDAKVIRSQHNSVVTSNPGLNGGMPGALTNQTSVPANAPIVAGKGAPNNVGSSSRQKDFTVNYEVDRTISHTVLPVGSIKRLFVAVLVNGNRKVMSANGKNSLKPFSDAEMEQINNLVKDATGFDQKRGDSLNVQIAAFTETKEVIEEIPFWKQPYAIELAKDIVKYSLIAAAIWFVIFNVIKPTFRTLLTLLNNSGGFRTTRGTAAPYEKNLQAARQVAKQEPKIVASVIKEWVKE